MIVVFSCPRDIQAEREAMDPECGKKELLIENLKPVFKYIVIAFLLNIHGQQF